MTGADEVLAEPRRTAAEPRRTAAEPRAHFDREEAQLVSALNAL
ncbi:hypothetical protein ACQPYK_26920 [Streptosporangium sp. CA-135522]